MLLLRTAGLRRGSALGLTLVPVASTAAPPAAASAAAFPLLALLLLLLLLLRLTLWRA